MSAREELRVQVFLLAGEDADGLIDAHRAEVRAETLAEAKTEIVAWLVKKAQEGTPVSELASKVDRGAVRIFLGTGHFRDAMDAHHDEVLREAADTAEQTFIHGVTPAASDRDEIWDDAVRSVATLLRGLANGDGEKASATTAPTATPQPDEDEWVRCSRPHCPNGEWFAKAPERGWEHGHMDTWRCPEHATPQPEPEPDDEPEPETDEERADRVETERAHAAGDHQYCGVTCEEQLPSEVLRNTILYRAIPGASGALDELLRRAAAASAPTATPQPDFFQPGHGYTHRDGSDFLTVAVTAHPITGEQRALGWVIRNGWHEAAALDPDDWAYNYDGVTPPTEAAQSGEWAAAGAIRDRLADLLTHIRKQPGRIWTSGMVHRFYLSRAPKRATARRDLETLHTLGWLVLHDAPGRRSYTLNTRKDGCS